ncbi:Mariner Mos1 transposase [Eumeta japonica]|uniref:Mariner Mos1 transposase n=1 Tax=Eumeta variegata TaxID=151549 RepID=A0A4C1UM58_EUMVA|nr:Mariner Mos1 transposase [Eumeta japonica]
MPADGVANSTLTTLTAADGAPSKLFLRLPAPPAPRCTARRFTRRLSRALEGKRLQHYSKYDRIILLHDNFRPHAAVLVKNYFKTLNWEVLPNPPYSPDIAPSNYNLFRVIAHALSEQRFICLV